MKLTHVIIHELDKEGGKIGASLNLFDSTIDSSSDKVIKLIRELNERYKNRSESYSVFDKNNPTVFHTSFDTYYKSREKKDFIKFSKQSSTDLKTRIDSISQAKGGYLIFAHYEHNRKYVGVFLVRNTLGLSFKADVKHNKFNINDVQHIDFENLAMACRISLDSYRKKEVRYLSFINKKGDEMSQYFTRWISSSETETNEEDTKQLYGIFNMLEPPVDEETSKPLERSDFLDRIYSSIKNKPGRMVNLRTLSEEFYGNTDYINDYIEKNGIIINGEFKAHPQALRKFIQIRAKADNIELSFPQSAFRSAVKLDENDQSQIIIKSEKLVQEIKSMIHREE